MTSPVVALPAATTTPLLGSHVYFLVSAAHTGPLAGAFKLGVADSLASRYHQHARTWQERFDPTRSALVRVERRQEAQWLESDLKRIFGRPGPGGRSWRRDPGRRADGYTEWFELDCLELMLVRVEGAVALREKLGVRAQISRGLSPADCALIGLAADGTPLPPQPGSRAGQRAQAQAEREQEEAIEDARAVAVAGATLELAQAYEEHLRWVGLDLWRWHIANPARRMRLCDAGWADLYFGGFGPPRARPRERSHNDPPPTPAQIRFEQDYERLLSAAPKVVKGIAGGPEYLYDLTDAVYSTGSTFRLSNGTVEAAGPFPHPVCADTLVLRLNFIRHEALQPFFARFEALAQRVACHHRWEQPDLLLLPSEPTGTRLPAPCRS